ncbi:hypothetical protein M378DRAFT_172112 [Amanita muscaria Koide BX008]|uniref:Uncharacterized protein n=1 Tax=Amanita muscaria (strain Koide BX008) TaxID=946122 RepID=A0A0C2WKA5_AMAMK|nr:hypothetical protein M378DRAFT_172112 [Amanita muscaria Koide BX008]
MTYCVIACPFSSTHLLILNSGRIPVKLKNTEKHQSIRARLGSESEELGLRQRCAAPMALVVPREGTGRRDVGNQSLVPCTYLPQ